MEDDALPQRENARRRKRDQQTLEHTSQHAVSTPTPSGGLVDDLSASVRDGDEVIPEGARANVEPSTSALVHDLNSAGTGSCGVDGQGRHPGSHDNGHTLPVYRSAAVGNFKFEYLDHTADVQLHAWGRHLTEAFEQCALAMFNYISPLEHVRMRDTRSYRVEGHDLLSLLYSFLDELHYVFATEMFIACKVSISNFNRVDYVIEAQGMGEVFDRNLHEVGTEIKAITYSAMTINEEDGDAEVFVIVDI